jgi:hypothetical protein
VAFQGGEVEVGDPGFADEADEQIPDHFRVGEQPFVTVVVVGHLSPFAFNLMRAIDLLGYSLSASRMSARNPA